MTEEEKSFDIELVKKAQKGDLDAQETLIARYAWLARSKARNYFLEGGTQEDLAQEGMLGIWKAIRDFNPDVSDSFVSFASMCISSQIKDALRSYNRNKHKILNEAVSLTSFDENIPPEYVTDPINNYVEKEGKDNFYKKLESICNAQQLTVLKYYFEGYTYSEIANMVDIPVKKVDNILLAIKTKIKKNKDLFIE